MERFETHFLLPYTQKRPGMGHVLYKEMEYIDCSSYNLFYPFQNKHKIHWHLQSVKKLCAYEKNQNIVKVMKWAS